MRFIYSLIFYHMVNLPDNRQAEKAAKKYKHPWKLVFSRRLSYHFHIIFLLLQFPGIRSVFRRVIHLFTESRHDPADFFIMRILLSGDDVITADSQCL